MIRPLRAAATPDRFGACLVAWPKVRQGAFVLWHEPVDRFVEGPSPRDFALGIRVMRADNRQCGEDRKSNCLTFA